MATTSLTRQAWEKLLGQAVGQVSPDDIRFQQMQKQMQMSQEMAKGLVGMAVASGAFSNQYAQNTPPNPDSLPLRALTLEDLKCEAATTSLENLFNLWQARWRSQWVRRGEIDGDFYNIAAARLNAARLLESHQLSNGALVYRLIERF